MSKANPNINLSRHGASREGSASSGRRRKDYWYYESSPSKQDEVVLDSRLRPRPGNERLDVLAEPRNYRNVKRELSEGSSSSERVAKIHKTSSLTVEVCWKFNWMIFRLL